MQYGPALRAAAAIAVLSVLDAFIKGMSAYYPTFQVAFMRFAFGGLVIGIVLAVARPGWPNRETFAANAVRAVVGFVTALSFFYALGQLPLAETLILSFLAPMFVALLGVVVLKERVDLRIIGAILLGFCGTLIVVAGQSEESGAVRSWTGVAAALGSAVTYAFSLVLLRQRAQKDKLLHIVAFINIGPGILVAPFAAMVWQPVAMEHLPWFALIGVLAISGHVLLVTAYARAEAARLAPLEYTALIWAVLLGYGAFNEVPTWATLGGGLLVILAALMTTRR
ncbi:DMT family transporter [Microvirga sp. ACRRW]|uniref:DMT family transporter n=1 Tax=Microvirga sp. ACRRW TaxID=2918205 RepID=UPI001EF4E348|nr:DMT family transporter [Microvirga sp. ACRRW]MCG7392209.1 DMT family transporter [Microvirga sp. ACRRW]